MSQLRVVFAGTPDFAAAHLKALLDARIDVCAVYTQPDRKSGRGRQLTPSPVKAVALEAGIPVEQPLNFKDDSAVDRLKEYQPDVMIVVAYGLLLPQSVLDIPVQGCINVHGSLLPRWRGAAPIQRAIWAGDTHTGIGIMQMEAGLDTGPVLLEESLEIADDETGGSLHDKLMNLGCLLLVQTLKDLPAYRNNAVKQENELATYAHKLSKAEGAIDWHADAQTIARQVRAFNPYPVAHSPIGDSTVRVWAAKVEKKDHQAKPGEIIATGKDHITVACGRDALVLTTVQLPGSKRMAVADVLLSKAALFSPGAVFGGAND